MNISNEKINRKDLIIWGVLFCLQVIILWVGITHEGVWYDEACSVGIIRHPISEIWQVVKGDVHPPLYFFMLKVFTSFFGNSVLVMRSLSALAILAVFLLGIGPIRRACGKTVGFWFSFFVMVTPIYLGMAQEIRMYTWAVFFVTGSLLYAYLAMAEGKKRDWILFGGFMLAAIYTHYYALMAMVILCGLITLWFCFNLKKRFNFMFLIVTGVAILCFLPWIFGFSYQVGGISHGNYWIPPVTFESIWQVLIYPFGYKLSIIDPLAPISFLLITGLILWGIVQVRLKKRKAPLVYWAVSVYILTLLAAVIFSFLFWPILFARHMLPVTALFLLGAAYGLAQIPNPKISLGIALVFVALLIPHLITINQSRFNGPTQEIVSYFKENAKPGDVFIHTAPNTWGFFCYYFPDYQQFFYTVHSDPGFAYCRTFEPNGSAGLDLRGFLQSNHPQNIWVIDEAMETENPVVMYLRNQPVLDTRLFKIPESWFTVRIFNIKPQ
ncbi:MAG TPA: glycosyltransferase family 39 protein [Bacillota bacterium]|nr:glycosyltransferase family 39 protein [Bacillota bacterium]